MRRKKKRLCVACEKLGLKEIDVSGGKCVERCLGCGLEWRKPLPSHSKVRSYYGKSYFDQSGDLKCGYPGYDRFMNSFLNYFSLNFKRIEENGVGKGEFLIDVGCGPGVFLNLAKSKGLKVMGVDISSEVAEIVKSRYGIKVKVGEFENLQFNKDSVDVITCFQTFEHVYRPNIFLKKAHQSLRKGGVLLVTTPNRDSLWRMLLGSRWFSYRHKEHLFFWGKEALLKALVSVGFSRINIFNDSWRWYNSSEFSSLLRAYGGRFGRYVPEVNGEVLARVRVPFPIGSIGVLARK